MNKFEQLNNELEKIQDIYKVEHEIKLKLLNQIEMCFK